MWLHIVLSTAVRVSASVSENPACFGKVPHDPIRVRVRI